VGARDVHDDLADRAAGATRALPGHLAPSAHTMIVPRGDELPLLARTRTEVEHLVERAHPEMHLSRAGIAPQNVTATDPREVAHSEHLRRGGGHGADAAGLGRVATRP